MVVRFLAIPRIRNPWIQLVVFGIGLFFAQQIMLYGIFLLPEFQTTFFILSGIAVLSYLPIWIGSKVTEKE